MSCCFVTDMEKLLFKPTGRSCILDSVRYEMAVCEMDSVG